MSEHKKHRAGIHKNISSIFKGMPTQQTHFVEQPVEEPQPAVEETPVPVEESQSVREPQVAVEESQEPVEEYRAAIEESQPEVEEAKPAMEEPQVPVEKPQWSIEEPQADGVDLRIEKALQKRGFFARLFGLPALARTVRELRAELKNKDIVIKQIKAEAENMLFTQFQRHSALAQRLQAQAREAAASTKEQVKETQEKLRSYSAALAKMEKRLQAAQEKAKAEAQARARLEEALNVERQARKKADTKSQETLEAARVQVEEKARLCANALARAEERLAKAQEQARDNSGDEQDGPKGGGRQGRKRNGIRPHARKVIDKFRRIVRAFLSVSFRKGKFAFVLSLGVLFITLLVVSIVNDSPNAGYAGSTEEEMLSAEDNLEMAQAGGSAVGSENITTKQDIPVLVNLTRGGPGSKELTYNVVTEPLHGSLSGTAPNLIYIPNRNFFGFDSFAYIVSDSVSEGELRTVSIVVSPIGVKPPAKGETVKIKKDDTPPVSDMVKDIKVMKITSKPVTHAAINELYTYDVDAVNPDVKSKLVYSLVASPDGMTVDSETGLIQWRPTQLGNSKVVVKVAGSSGEPSLDVQSFNLTVGPPMPKIATLTVQDGYNHASRKTLVLDGKTGVVWSDDENRLETGAGLYTTYDFSDVSIPAGARITSVIMYVEHYEQERFVDGKLKWSVGTGWPNKPVVWGSLNAPVHAGEFYESVDSWDVASIVDTREKVNSLQLHIKNDDNITRGKTFVNQVYAVVQWD